MMVTLTPGNGGLPRLQVTTAWSTAEIYLQGATVTHFQPSGQPPLLFLSARSRFEADAPIRGGIPIVFPWFGKPADRPLQHGFARSTPWQFLKATPTAAGAVTLHLHLPAQELLPGVPLDYFITVGAQLHTELVVTNHTPHPLTFENCLHTYFTVGDITQVSVVGLQGVEYLDALEQRARKREANTAIRFTGEVDRAFMNTTHPVEIRDASFQRIIRVHKTGSASTVVWNPWIAKAQAMPDFGDDEYQRMVCVESGNCFENAIRLPAGATAQLGLTLSSVPLALPRDNHTRV